MVKIIAHNLAELLHDLEAGSSIPFSTSSRETPFISVLRRAHARRSSGVSGQGYFP